MASDYTRDSLNFPITVRAGNLNYRVSLEAKTISLPGEVKGGEGRGDGYVHEVKAQKLLVSYDIASVCNHTA